MLIGNRLAWIREAGGSCIPEYSWNQLTDCDVLLRWSYITKQLSFTGAAPPTTHLVVVFNSGTIRCLGHVRIYKKFSPGRNPGSLFTLRETVFCSTSNRNCSCSSDAVSAGWEGSARNPCCLVLGSKYCSNIRVSCCKLDAVRVSVLLPSSTKSPEGWERQLLSHLGYFQLAEKHMLHLRTTEQSSLLNMWSAGFSFSICVKLSLMQHLCLYRVKRFLFLFLWKSYLLQSVLTFLSPQHSSLDVFWCDWAPYFLIQCLFRLYTEISIL